MGSGLPASPRLGAWFGRVIRIGRTPHMEPSVARYVVLTNIMAVLGVATTLSFAPVLALTGSLVYPLLQLVYAAAYATPLVLNRRGHHVAATTALLVASQLTDLAQVVVDGRGFDIQLMFVLHAVLPFLLFAPRHEGLMLSLSALAGLELVVVIVFGAELPHLGPAIAADRVAVIRPILAAGLFATLAACAYYARNATLIAEDKLDRAHQRSEDLLLNILPPSIAGRLKTGNGTIADGFAEVTVLFADIVGFTTLSSQMAPARVVDMLNHLFCTFDDLAGHLGLEKIKTIGDCYMLAGGLPEPRADHAEVVATMALGMLRVVRELPPSPDHPKLEIRIGIHSGPVVAGVIGKRKFLYDLWGDTVNTASRMESHGVPGAVQLSESCHALLGGKFRMRERGTIEIKGKGAMRTWLLEEQLPVRAEPVAAASPAPV